MHIRQFFLALVFSLTFVVSLVWADGYAVRTVQAGESLGSVAQLYGTTVSAILEFNELSSEVIHPGEVLKIPYAQATGGIAEVAPKPPPGFITYTLGAGDTLSAIAGQHELTLEAIVGANPNISSLDQLPAGIELLLPPAEGLVITLRDGESLVDIIREYGVDPVTVVRVNGFVSPADIIPGTMVFLPEVAPTRALERLARVREEENRYIWPVHGRITSYFGRRNLGMGTSSFHSAIDVATAPGTAIIAARSGVVTYAGWSNRGYGNLIKVQHPGGAETWYAHGSELYVSVGDYVKQGETIAAVGSTGLSTGPHLHFELHESGNAVDPLAYLR